MAFSTNPDDLARELWSMKEQINRTQNVVVDDLYFNYLRARDADFDYFGFLGGLGFNRGSSQDLPSDTYTAIQWTGLRAGGSRQITWSSVAGISSRITPSKPRDNDLYMFFGSVEFSSGSTVGVRELTFTEDVGLGFIVARMSQGDPSTTFVIPFSVGYRCFSTITFFTLNAFQDTGSTRSIMNADMWALRFT